MAAVSEMERQNKILCCDMPAMDVQLFIYSCKPIKSQLVVYSARKHDEFLSIMF